MGVYYNSFNSLQCGQKYVDAAFYSPFMSQTVNKKSRTVAIVPHPLPAWCTLLQITGIKNFLEVFWTEKSYHHHHHGKWVLPSDHVRVKQLKTNKSVTLCSATGNMVVVDIS